MKKIINIINNKKGEAQVNTAMKIVIAVIIGALLLGGLYLLFAGENGVMEKVDDEVGGMMDYGEDGITVQRELNDAGVYQLKFSYDNRHWYDASMPDYGDTASVYGVINGGEGENASYAALIQNGNTYYLIASKDGANWSERFSFTATAITHFYYGTNTLPSTSGSFSGEKFVLRYQRGGSTYFSPVASYATKWTNATWSDIIRPN